MIQVASYCRVSTDQEDQVNSFEAQQRYFREYIAGRPDWQLYDIYADEGITGTSTRKRAAFNRMICDAYSGKFQLILTKEVSRFSRNIVDTLSYTRELKKIGVTVEFLTDRIHTASPDAELYLSIMASIAQEESRKTSMRVVWGQTRQMEQGIVFGRSLLGYEVQNGKLSIEPQGAQTVWLIFQKYAIEQVSTSQIARELTRKQILTGAGSTKWSASTVVKILKNEKYAGDLIQKKTYTPDYLTHEKRPNKGQVPLICLKDHHTPIISREIWDLAQARLQQNSKHRSAVPGHSNRYLFSGKIRCGECGAAFVGRSQRSRGCEPIRRWRCAAAVQNGAEGCGIGRLLRDDDGLQMLKTTISKLPLDRKTITRRITALVLETIGSLPDPERIQNLLAQLQEKKEAMLDSYFAGILSQEELSAMKQRYARQEQALRQRLVEAEQAATFPDLEAEIHSCISALLSGETANEAFYRAILDHITVFRDGHAELHLQKLPMLFRFSR